MCSKVEELGEVRGRDDEAEENQQPQDRCDLATRSPSRRPNCPRCGGELLFIVVETDAPNGHESGVVDER